MVLVQDSRWEFKVDTIASSTLSLLSSRYSRGILSLRTLLTTNIKGNRGLIA